MCIDPFLLGVGQVLPGRCWICSSEVALLPSETWKPNVTPQPSVHGIDLEPIITRLSVLAQGNASRRDQRDLHRNLINLISGSWFLTPNITRAKEIIEPISELKNLTFFLVL